MAELRIQVADYPRAPWVLRGDAFVATLRVRQEVAQRFVPRELRIVPIAPGQTLAILAFIRYGAGSTLQYHELIVAPALVRVGWHVGSWISHIYVDSELSLRGGREIWGVPKEPATFDWSGERVAARTDAMQAVIEPTRAGSLRWRMPILGPMFGSTAQSWRWAVARGTTLVKRMSGRIDLRGEHLETLGFAAVTSLYRLERFHLKLAAPRGAMPRSFNTSNRLDEP